MQVNPDVGRLKLKPSKTFRHKTLLGKKPIYSERPYFIFEGDVVYLRQDKIHPIGSQRIWVHSPPAERNEMMDFVSRLRMPRFLDRSKWSQADHERDRKLWQERAREERERIAKERAKTDKLIFAKVRRHNQIKTIKLIKKNERRERVAEAKARRLRRDRIRGENDETVLSLLHKGFDTAGKLAKATEIERKEVSRSLRRLVVSGKADKLSPRTYGPASRDAPQRAPDKPRRKRTRLKDLKRKKR